MRIFVGQIVEIKELDGYEREVLGAPYQVTAVTKSQQTFIYPSPEKLVRGAQVRVESVDAEWTGTHWQITEVL